MTHTRLTLQALFGLLLLALFIIPQPGASHLLDQSATPSPTPEPATPIAYSTKINGKASYAGENHYFSFTVPDDQDVVVVFNGSGVFFVTYCITTEGGEFCNHEGGGGDGDPPTKDAFVIPSTLPGDVVLTVMRVQEGSATFDLTIYPVTPLPLAFGAPLLVRPDDNMPYQVLTLEADQTKPFSIQAHDTTPDNNYLWLNNQPNAYGSSNIASPDWATFPFRLDGAELPNSRSLAYMLLYYVGKNTFRILVNSPTAYQVNAQSLEPMTIPKGSAVTATISDHQPVWDGAFEVKSGETYTITMKVIDGSGALLVAYQGQHYLSVLELGTLSVSEFPREGETTFTAPEDGTVSLILNIPSPMPPGSVTVQIGWANEFVTSTP